MGILHTSFQLVLPVAVITLFAVRTNERNMVCELGHHHLKL